MTKKETSHLLAASAELSSTASHLLLVPAFTDDKRVADIMALSMELLAFAREHGDIK